MAQQGPNPIEVYEGAVQSLLPIIAGIKPDQVGAATPCSEWNVGALINHNILVSQFAGGIITGKDAGVNPFAPSSELPSEGAVAAFEAGTKAILEAIKVAGALEKEVETPFGRMPVSNFLMIPMADMVVHKWDLAKATNQDTSLDSNLAEVCYQCLTPAVAGGREAGFFGNEVSIPISASIQERLLGLTGRKP